MGASGQHHGTVRPAHRPSEEQAGADLTWAVALPSENNAVEKGAESERA